MSSQIVNQQQSYQIPTKPYYLAPTICPLEEICVFTNNLAFVSEDFRANLFCRISSRQWSTTVGMFNAPQDVNALKMIIGEDGYFLKLTTRNCDVDMIWHDRQNNMFLFWGPSIYAVVQAMNQIRSRIIKYTVYIKPQQATYIQPQEQASARQDGIEDITDDEDDEYADMPPLMTWDGKIVN